MTAENGLDIARQFARTRGWYCLPLLPLMKLPGISAYYSHATLNDVELVGLWRRAGNYARWIDAQHPDYTEIKNKDLVAEVLKVREFKEDWASLPPGVGINLAASGLVGIDVDTFVQERIWRKLCAENDYDPGPRTVASPGVINKDGSAKHDGLGHYYFTLPDDLKDLNRSQSGVNMGIGEAEGEDTADRPAIMAGRRYLVLPPTQRPEGFYVRTEGTEVRPLPPFLAQILRNHFEEAEEAKKRSEAIAAKRTREDALWRWHVQTPWSTVLPTDWSLTGHDGTCEVYAHPKSGRSAVAHEPGCRHLKSDKSDVNDVTPPPITFHTTTVPQYIEDALKTVTNDSVSKLKLLAFKDYGGDIRAARRALGLPDRAPTRHAPAKQQSTQPRHEQVLRVRRPLPDYSNASTALPESSTVAAEKPAVVEKAVSEPPATDGTQTRIVRGRHTLRVRRPLPDYGNIAVAEKPTIVEAVAPVEVPVPEAPVAVYVEAPDETVESIETVEIAETVEAPVETPAEEIVESVADGFTEVTDADLDALNTWQITHPMNRLHELILERAVPATVDTLNGLLHREVRAGNFCGMPNQPQLWSSRDLEARADRRALAEIEHFSTLAIADELYVPTHRAQSWLRAMIPVMRNSGVLLREREDDKDFNTYNDNATASVNTMWAAWKLTTENGDI